MPQTPPQTHTRTQPKTHPNTQTLSQTLPYSLKECLGFDTARHRAFPSKKEKTTACWRHAYCRKVAGLQCHSLRSGEYPIWRTFLSEIKVCAVSPAETETNVCVSLLWCFVLEKSLEVNRYPTCEKTRNYFMKSDQFSEVVMNVSSEIAWGIIRDNSCFLLKKRGELHQDDFS